MDDWHKPSSKHEELFKELCDILKLYEDKVNTLEMLAVVSNLVGKLAAMQDKRKVTPELVNDIIAKNIERGNKDAIEGMQNVKRPKI